MSAFSQDPIPLPTDSRSSKLSPRTLLNKKLQRNTNIMENHKGHVTQLEKEIEFRKLLSNRLHLTSMIDSYKNIKSLPEDHIPQKFVQISQKFHPSTKPSTSKFLKSYLPQPSQSSKAAELIQSPTEPPKNPALTTSYHKMRPKTSRLPKNSVTKDKRRENVQKRKRRKRRASVEQKDGFTQAQFYQHLRHMSMPQKDFRKSIVVKRCMAKQNQDLEMNEGEKAKERPKTARTQCYSKTPQMMESSVVHAIINKDENAILEHAAQHFGEESVAHYTLEKEKLKPTYTHVPKQLKIRKTVKRSSKNIKHPFTCNLVDGELRNLNSYSPVSITPRNLDRRAASCQELDDRGTNEGLDEEKGNFIGFHRTHTPYLEINTKNSKRESSAVNSKGKLTVDLTSFGTVHKHDSQILKPRLKKSKTKNLNLDQKRTKRIFTKKISKRRPKSSYGYKTQDRLKIQGSKKYKVSQKSYKEKGPWNSDLTDENFFIGKDSRAPKKNKSLVKKPTDHYSGNIDLKDILRPLTSSSKVPSQVRRQRGRCSPPKPKPLAPLSKGGGFKNPAPKLKSVAVGTDLKQIVNLKFTSNDKIYYQEGHQSVSGGVSDTESEKVSVGGWKEIIDDMVQGWTQPVGVYIENKKLNHNNPML
ncbi:unnamed protein product [Moneuplotes crassus]|uniref:Uncharacterized protein n=1 Tax=Euplotes crassus TaxID=5936 RepID=A0AAD1XYH2_EUPCR|nr:unnamed protein product [Moneuplotes crassus]